MALDFPHGDSIPGLFRRLNPASDSLGEDCGSSRSSNAPIARFPDGIVILDPVNGRLVTLAPMAWELLAFIRARIRAGVADRETLLAELVAQLETDCSAARERLRSWVDLASHLES